MRKHLLFKQSVSLQLATQTQCSQAARSLLKWAPAVKPLRPLSQHCVWVRDCLCTVAQRSPHVSKARLNMKYCMLKCHHGKQGRHKRSKAGCIAMLYFLTVLLLNRRHTVLSPSALEGRLCPIACAFKCKAHWRHYVTFFLSLIFMLPLHPPLHSRHILTTFFV